MASVDSPRGLVLARKNGSGSNSTGVTMIPVGDNISPIVPSAALPTSMFTGDPIAIYSGSSAGETDDYPWYEVRINNHIDNYTTATISSA
jgi:hypothetical protein